jgi:hypothetical protein
MKDIGRRSTGFDSPTRNSFFVLSTFHHCEWRIFNAYCKKILWTERIFLGECFVGSRSNGSGRSGAAQWGALDEEPWDGTMWTRVIGRVIGREMEGQREREGA